MSTPVHNTAIMCFNLLNMNMNMGMNRRHYLAYTKFPNEVPYHVYKLLGQLKGARVGGEIDFNPILTFLWFLIVVRGEWRLPGTFSV